jgi:hypothetical protein
LSEDKRRSRLLSTGRGTPPEDVLERAEEEVRTICDRGLAELLLFAHEVATYVSKRGSTSVEDAARGAHQTADFDPAVFRSAASESLRIGAFRLVLVLDEAPDELVQLVVDGQDHHQPHRHQLISSRGDRGRHPCAHAA